ncbi:hypothetical protein [Nocardia testacea]|uniref:hypothetical protein n=1 Tax=Nocardia testacea TaxID=248551 RepID=UPI003A8A9087
MTTGTQADIAAVQMMMERFGLTVADLGAAVPAETARLAPAFADFIPTAIERMPAGRTRDHYCTYWNKILAQPGWGERRLDEPTTADLQVLCEQIRASRGFVAPTAAAAKLSATSSTRCASCTSTPKTAGSSTPATTPRPG